MGKSRPVCFLLARLFLSFPSLSYADAILCEATMNVSNSATRDLLYKTKKTISVPIEYRFFTVQIPDDMKPYVTVVPSDDNAGQKPLFFDFNV